MNAPTYYALTESSGTLVSSHVDSEGAARALQSHGGTFPLFADLPNVAERLAAGDTVSWNGFTARKLTAREVSVRPLPSGGGRYSCNVWVGDRTCGRPATHDIYLKVRLNRAAEWSGDCACADHAAAIDTAHTAAYAVDETDRLRAEVAQLTAEVNERTLDAFRAVEAHAATIQTLRAVALVSLSLARTSAEAERVTNLIPAGLLD